MAKTKKRKAVTKVSLKTTFSNPRLAKLAELAPQTRPNPTPLFCRRIRRTKTKPNIICKIKRIFFIFRVIIHETNLFMNYLINQLINEAMVERRKEKETKASRP